jgi:hypothetical protein
VCHGARFGSGARRPRHARAEATLRVRCAPWLMRCQAGTLGPRRADQGRRSDRTGRLGSRSGRRDRGIPRGIKGDRIFHLGLISGSSRSTNPRCTRDASRDIKPGCQDHHPAAIGPQPPPSDPRPTGRGARQLLRMCRQSSRWLFDTAGLPIGAVDRNSGLTRCRRWRTCWIVVRSGGTKCPPASRTARRRKRLMPCWSCAVMSKIFRRSSCQKASDGTDGAHRWRYLLLPGPST